MPPKPNYANYKITNTVNGMMYIGSARWNPDYRWVQHRSNARGGMKNPLYDAMREFGIERFTFEVILQHGNERDMLTAENAIIVVLNTIVPNGYNRMHRKKSIIRKEDAIA